MPIISKNFKRFALYYTAEQGSFGQNFGRHWFGHCLETGQACPIMPHHALPWDLETHRRYTAIAARYGFHATLKPPFYMQQGLSYQDLDQALLAFTAQQLEISSGPLKLSRISSFLALVPTDPVTSLSAFAAQCIQQFDSFRAPPTEQELTRRRQKTLSPAQEIHLQKWGYPYVLDCFRFHITLTANLTEAEQEKIVSFLQNNILPFQKTDFHIREICLCGEPYGDQQNMPFQLLKRYPLKSC